MPLLPRIFPGPQPRRDATAIDLALVIPLAPSAYLELRRTRAGFTQAELARRLTDLDRNQQPHPRRRLSVDEGRDQYRRHLDTVRTVERPGTVIRDDALLVALCYLLDADPAVYRALATEPPRRQPRVCRGCGCSDTRTCLDRNDNCCRWATPGLCTRCEKLGVAALAVAA